MSHLAAIPILGIPIHMTDLEQAVRWAGGVIRGETAPAYVCHINVHSLICAQDDAELANALAGAALAAADGMPLVWIGRAHGVPAGRVYGPDFMRALLAHGAELGRPCRHFLYGSTPAVLDRLEERLKVQFTHAHLCGTLSPPFRPLSDEEARENCRHINAAKPDVVWVGLGAPNQELWMARHRALLDAPLLAGVGAAFDFLACTKPQAPRWLRQAGLEWAFRLATEPRRLARRYAETMPRFLVLVALEAIRSRIIGK